MRKNRVLIIDHDLQTCKDIKYNVDSEKTDAYYTLNIREGLTELADKLEAFKIGADDYLPKPFETEECPARVLHFYAASVS